MQKQQLVGVLGLLWKRVKEIASLDTKIDNKASAVSGVVCVVCPFAGDEKLKTFMLIQRY